MDWKSMSKDNNALAWKYRILCSDESCIGVIGPDMRCRECGRRYEGELPPRFEEFITRESGDNAPGYKDVELEGLEVDDEIDDVDNNEPVTDEEWANRILCSDDNCIGVIGSDGCCKDCGKPLEKEH
jgi:hypothetical protein